MPWAGKRAKRWLLGIAAILIGILALSLRLLAVKSLPNDYDEWVYLTASRNYASAIQLGNWQAIPQSTDNYEHPAFAKLVYAVGMADLKLIPIGNANYLVNEICTEANARSLMDRSRTIAAVFGALAAGLLALVNPLAGLLLAVHTFAVKYTSVVYLEALPALTSLVAVIAYSRWSKVAHRPNARRGRDGVAWLAFSAAMLGMSAASKYMYAIVGIVILLHYLLSSLWRRRFDPGSLALMAVWGCLAVLVFFACDPYLWPDPIHRLQASLSFSTAYSEGDYVKSFQYPIWQPLRWLSRPVTTFKARVIPQVAGNFPVAWDALIMWLAVLGFPRLAKKQPLYALWLVVGVFFLLLWGTKWPQYVLVVLAPWCFAAGEGLLTLFWLARFALFENKHQPA